jgi:CHAT domain-containing protein
MLVAEPGPPGPTFLDNVVEEVRTCAALLRSASAEVINDVNSTTSIRTVLDGLPAAHFLHLACHGYQHDDPLQSCFALSDGSLTISSLMELQLPHAMVAFLSACDTAKGDRNQPDQAVHLAASMLFCGFKSVVGTLW